VNTKIRLITRIAFGFKNVDALIASAATDRPYQVETDPQVCQESLSMGLSAFWG
jgi:hypothetical protein